MGHCPVAHQHWSKIPLHALGNVSLLKSLNYQFSTGFSPGISFELHGRENGSSSCLLTVDQEKERTRFQFHCSDVMLSYNYGVSFPVYKWKSSLLIFVSIITYPCNSILTVFYTLHLQSCIRKNLMVVSC